MLKHPGANSIMKKIFTASFFIGLVLFQADAAWAHAQLTSSYPLANRIIRTIPMYAWVEFDGNLMTFGDKNPNVITVLDSKKKRVDIGSSLLGGARLSTKLKSGLKPGRYQVCYRVVSEDGHPVTGSYFFTYQP
jgi:methionine-rich copper-binding protein CopC